MEIKLTLDHYCIETAAKKAYEASLREYFRSKCGASVAALNLIEERIESLKFFLEHADFGSLRGQHPELNGNAHATVFLVVPDDGGAAAIRCGGRTIEVSQHNQ